MTLINKSQFLHPVLNSVQRGSLGTLDTTAPSVLEFQIFFHTIAMVKNTIQAKALKSSISYSARALLGRTVQKISKAWTAFAKTANLAPLAKLRSPCILFDLKKKPLLVQSAQKQGFVPCEQLHHLLYGKGVVDKESNVDNGA